METCILTWISGHLLELATVALAIATVWLALEARQSSIRQIGVQTWLELERRFDSDDIRNARKGLAFSLASYKPENHDDVSEEFLDILESISTVYNLGLLNKELAVSSFSYYAARWWIFAEPYIKEERRRQGDDQTLFAEFENFAKAMRVHDEKIDDADMQKFVKNEMHLWTKPTPPSHPPQTFAY